MNGESGFFVVSDPEEQRRILSALLGGKRPPMPGDDHAAQDADARAKLKALGWTDADCCALATAQQYCLRFMPVQHLAGHLGCRDHGNLAAARLSVAMIDLALELQARIDAAFVSIGWPARPAHEWEAMRANRTECADNVKRLEDEAALRAELDAMPSVDAGGAP